MKVLLFLTIIVLTLAIVSAAKCPDGGNCDGECCRKAIIGNSYYCCRGIFKCQMSVGVGYCLPFRIPLPFPIAKSKSSLPEVQPLWTKSSENAKRLIEDENEPEALALANTNMAMEMKKERVSKEHVPFQRMD